MNTKVSPTTITLRAGRVIKAPRERVFAAWTTPDAIMKWFGPETCQALSAKVDLRVGGKYQVRMKTEKFGEVDVEGVYREVKPPGRLVYTWNWKGNPQLEFGETLVTVDFVDKEGFTEVQVTHDGFPAAEASENHKHGWNGCFDKLEKQMAAGSGGEGCARPGAFCWNELLTTDTGAAAKFYGQLFGWKPVAFPGGMNYSMLNLDGESVGGMMPRPNEKAPPHWLAYVKVESVDATIQKAGGLGAKVLMPGMDIPTIGRVAVFQDPQGAVLGIFQPVAE